uniref:Uncharacterized protein n=1 Tax=Amphimedon queenslandica TaxID=400682 RepID=A0A1X7TI16_AMPQE
MYTRRKGKSSARRESSRQFHRNLVCIDYYQQPSHTLRQHNKVFEGFITLSSSMTESIVRKEIIEKLKDKDYMFYNFDTLTSNDFEFVKCVNRHIFVPDGATAYDGNGIMSLYR